MYIIKYYLSAVNLVTLRTKRKVRERNELDMEAVNLLGVRSRLSKYLSENLQNIVLYQTEHTTFLIVKIYS